jgi:hypothetical protein
MSKLFDKHIELVKMVNSADSELQHRLADERLDGFRLACGLQGINQLIECDMYYIDKGIDRPMCAGVFLDWEASV